MKMTEWNKDWKGPWKRTKFQCDICCRSGVKLWRPFGGYPGENELLCGKHLWDYPQKLRHQKEGPGIPSNIKITYMPAILEFPGNLISFETFHDCPQEKVKRFEQLPN